MSNTNAKLVELKQYPLLDIQEGMATLGSESAVKNMLSLFAEKGISHDEILAFRTACANKDWKKVTTITHKLKGACTYCGVVRLYYVCQYIEDYYRTGNRELLEKLCKQFLSVLDQTNAEIVSWLKTH